MLAIMRAMGVCTPKRRAIRIPVDDEIPVALQLGPERAIERDKGLIIPLVSRKLCIGMATGVVGGQIIRAHARRVCDFIAWVARTALHLHPASEQRQDRVRHGCPAHSRGGLLS